MEGKVAIVTGAAGGIGQSCTEILLENKVKVCMVDVNSILGEKTVEQLRQRYGKDNVIFIKCDITSYDLLEAVFKETMKTFGRLDIVFNNAGICDESKMKDMIATNLAATIQSCYLGIKYMGTDNGGKGGVIINMGSITGLFPIDLVPCYGATKHGVVGFTRSMGSISPRLHGIRMNALCPGWVDTPFLAVIDKEGGFYGPDGKQRADDLLQAIGMISSRTVAESFWKLLLDDTLSGQCVIVGPDVDQLAHKMPNNYQEALNTYSDYKA